MWTGGDTVVTYIDNNSIKRVFQSLLKKNIDINYGKYSHEKKKIVNTYDKVWEVPCEINFFWFCVVFLWN